MNKLPIDNKKLNKLVNLCLHFNVFPIFLPNCFYSQGPPEIATLFSKLVEECENWLSAMRQEEINQLIESLPSSVRQFIEYETKSNQQPDLERIAIYYLVAEVQAKYHPIKNSWEYNLEKSEVLKVYPELEAKLDKDGLLKIDSEIELLAGGIVYRDHVLHYHQLLRRGFGSNPNFDFTGRFLAYYYKTRLTNSFRVAIDHRRIMAKEFYQQMYEFDTWYGPPFDPTTIDNPKTVGLTIVKRNKDSLFELTNKLERTEFFWSYRDGIKTFEVEEISDLNYAFEGYYLNRYIHSERDTRNQVLRHLDGAVKVYLPDRYKIRFQCNIPKEERCHAKPKLFRIDGDISIPDWINLISFFFKSNEMVIEYFNPEEFKKVFEERVRDFKAWKQKQRN